MLGQDTHWPRPSPTDSRTVDLVDDPRQHNQLLAVNNNLQAVESPQGHGDSFWSVALALPEKDQQQEAFVVFGH